MINSHDKVRGGFLGVGIGDSLGKPCECLTAPLIAREFGRITDYFQNPKHKYFDGEPAGSWTDDTQLSLAVARGFLPTGQFDLDAIAGEHRAEYEKSVSGWGTTTREAVARMVGGVHRSRAALAGQPGRGTGNGVAMKVAPVGLYMGLTNPDCDEPQWSRDIEKVADLATMTHRSDMAVASGVAQAVAVLHCFRSHPETFDVEAFIREITRAVVSGRLCSPKTAATDDLAGRLKLLERHDEYPPGRIITEFRGGPYVYESLPFTLMFFCRNPRGIDALYDCVSAGGDTDTNGSMIGALLGALHGTGIFPPHLVEGLQDREAILGVADRFYERLVKT